MLSNLYGKQWQQGKSVQQFLNDFKVKMSIFQILFRDERKKNTQAILSLEMSWEKRKKGVIESLEVADYFEWSVR